MIRLTTSACSRRTRVQQQKVHAMPTDSRRLFRAATAGSDLRPVLQGRGTRWRELQLAASASAGVRAQNREYAANFGLFFNRAVSSSEVWASATLVYPHADAWRFSSATEPRPSGSGLPAYSQLTIQAMPNWSLNMAKPGDQNVFANGISTFPFFDMAL
jgi:hypothetical protein